MLMHSATDSRNEGKSRRNNNVSEVERPGDWTLLLEATAFPPALAVSELSANNCASESNNEGLSYTLPSFIFLLELFSFCEGDHFI